MTRKNRSLVITACLIQAGLATAQLAKPAHGSSFTAFAEDEDVCRRAGALAIRGVPEVSAARRYDFAYRNCMLVHGQRRAYARGEQPGSGYRAGNPHSAEFPDAFYSIPYATPGYGYDGFSAW